MRVTYDSESDIAKIYVSEERQSYDDGATYLLVVDEHEHHEEREPVRSPLFVQIAFEAYERLLWIQVHDASRSLPEAVLRDARPERLEADDEGEPPPALG